MFPLSIVFIIQIALVVHVFRTGRPYFWAFIIFFLPAIGSIAYVVVELLPEWTGSPGFRRAFRGVRRTIDPGAELRMRQKQHSLSGSVDATRHLASELTESGRFAEAIDLYQDALTGLYEHDPALLLGLAEAQFGNQQYAEARRSLERLREHNPDFRSPEGHLLYARAIEQCGELEKAEEEYAAVAAYFAGAEAKVRYARLLERLQKNAKAREIFGDVLETAEVAPRHYRKAQRAWISDAKEGLQRLT